MRGVMLLAQTTQPTGPPAGSGADMFPLIAMGLAILAFYFVIFRGQRRDRQKHADMLSSIQRNDRVQTIGGVLGTVVDVREREVVLKVDEANNIKMRFNRDAVKEVLRDEES